MYVTTSLLDTTSAGLLMSHKFHLTLAHVTATGAKLEAKIAVNTLKTTRADKLLQDENTNTRNELTNVNEYLARLKVRCDELERELADRDTLITHIKHQLERRGVMLPEMGSTVPTERQCETVHREKR